MTPLSEDEIAETLAAAVATYASDSTEAKLEAVRDWLANLLYHAGCDGVFELTVSESTSTHISLVGVVIWVTEQTFGPLEADFEREERGERVTGFTVRAGDGRIARRDCPEFPQSARALQRIIASRPDADEDWEHVVIHELA